ncbi:hypothetical protein E7T09_02470 [Deinococcus sp. KSM4-11]|uniref:hypothetical protein n=1 Tax=Deinococcus sp. KSM4-11 TaxID=2568654 RepID=UPI0010A354A1|nr:hypothetical protein [Deinococcus sp. KSM4-11]THF88099.1 hypothetical protein E7T09_02470 [Deinococcus sp. KSM4-11]
MSIVYLILLTLHNINRWLVLITGVWTLVRTIPGTGSRRPFTAADRRPIVAFTGTVHLQLILGLLLFAFLGMQHIPVFAGAPNAGFQWQHLGLGLLAAITATVGSALSRRAPTDQGKFRVATTWTVVTLLLVLLLIPWWRPLLRLFTA